MSSIRRALAAMAVGLALTATGALVAVPSASAKEGPLSIQSVWVGDGQQHHRTVLNSGETAAYHINVDNTTGKAMQVEIEFEVFDIDGPSSYSYYYTAHKVYIPAGVRWFYSPSAIPATATTGNYMARISIWPTNSANPSNDGDWASADFHIFSLSPSPVNAAIEDLQNLALCIAGPVADGADTLALKTIVRGAKTFAIFEDLQTGDYYKAAVASIKYGDCVAALYGLPALLQTYKMVKI
jgi:hypothetical protein